MFQDFYLKNQVNSAMLYIAKITSCSPHSPAAVPLRKLVAAGEIPDTGVCSAPESFISVLQSGRCQSMPPHRAFR